MPVPEKFDCVTILFSDIVTFTNIAAACCPMDIVNMLNELFHRFDTHTTVHDVYKVSASHCQHAQYLHTWEYLRSPHTHTGKHDVYSVLST